MRWSRRVSAQTAGNKGKIALKVIAINRVHFTQRGQETLSEHRRESFAIQCSRMMGLKGEAALTFMWKIGY